MIIRNLGSDFDDFLSEHGLLAKAEAVARKRMLELQKGESISEPKDEWERQLLSNTKDCGVSLSDSAVSSEELYE